MTRVLVVDDSETCRVGVTALLESAGMTVVGHCSDGTQVVDAFRSGAPDVVLMDLSMPGMNGVEATRRLLAEAPGARVLVWTVSMSMVPGALAVGASGYLLKSEDSATLLAAVRGAASHRSHSG